MSDVLRHPGVETALTVGDIEPGLRFITYVPKGDVVNRGTFLTTAEYDEADPRWNALAQIGDRTIQLCLRDVGITPDGTGEWAECVTIIDDSED